MTPKDMDARKHVPPTIAQRSNEPVWLPYNLERQPA